MLSTEDVEAPLDLKVREAQQRESPPLEATEDTEVFLKWMEGRGFRKTLTASC